MNILETGLHILFYPYSIGQAGLSILIGDSTITSFGNEVFFPNIMRLEVHFVLSWTGVL